MQHLPLFADLKSRQCLVVGGGTVAEKRVGQLLSVQARVTVLAAELNRPLAALAAGGAIEFEPGSYDGRALDAYWLVVAATDDQDVNAQVAAAAEAAHRFCNVVDDIELCTFLMPAIVDYDPVTIAIGTSGQSPVMARWLKGLIETAIPTRIGALARLAGRWRARIRAGIPAFKERRRFWESVLTSDIAEHAYAGRDAEAERALAEALESWRDTDAPAASAGEAYLVGAGPGSPDLITVRGRQLLAYADVVLYDRLVNPSILSFARRDAELVCVGKTPSTPSITQAQLNRLLVQLVASGKRVCRLKGGDPMIFGRAGEELEALAEARLPFQIVPGVSAVEGCAAYAGIPLTLRGVAHAILITTGHTSEQTSPDLAAYRRGQTLALYMGVARFGSVAAELLSHGHDPETPAAIVENGTLPEQRVLRTTLRDLERAAREHAVSSPALLLVGDTVRHAERYSWFNRNVLSSDDDATTRTADRSRALGTKRQP